MPRPRRPLDDERRAAIVEAVCNGERLKMIGARFRTSRQHIRVLARRADVAPRPRLNPWTAQ